MHYRHKGPFLDKWYYWGVVTLHETRRHTHTIVRTNPNFALAMFIVGFVGGGAWISQSAILKFICKVPVV